MGITEIQFSKCLRVINKKELNQFFLKDKLIIIP